MPFLLHANTRIVEKAGQGLGTPPGAGLTRLQDYWHHVEDVAAGFALGLTMAYAFYRQIYPGVMEPGAGALTALRPPGGSGGSGSGRSLSAAAFGALLAEGEGEGGYDQRADSRV